MKTDAIENLTTPPKKQWASSVFHQMVGSLPAAILLAIASTWLMYAVLPLHVADTYAPWIWGSCLAGGTGSMWAGAAAFAKRALNLTDAHIANNTGDSNVS